jgi:hypothetical protein
VKAGDTLESIGRPHSHTKYDVARINRRSYSTPLVPGEELIVYKIIDRQKAKETGVFKKAKHHQARKGKPVKPAPAKPKARKR